MFILNFISVIVFISIKVGPLFELLMSPHTVVCLSLLEGFTGLVPRTKIYRCIVVCVICVYDMGKEIEQACQAATFVLEAMLRVTDWIVKFQVCD